mgnify:CR=1 FL=1
MKVEGNCKMSRLSKIETYITISKLIDIGEDELADKLLKIITDSSQPKLSFHYSSTFLPKNTREINTTMNRINKSIRRM